MRELLVKMRKLNQLIQRQAAETLDFDDVAKVIAHNIGANIYIISQDGHLLGYSLDKVKICDIMIELLNEGRVFPQVYNEELNEAEETQVNIPRNGKCAFRPGHLCHMGNKFTTIIPIIGSGERLGTMVLSKLSEFHDADLILAEYCATVVGIEIVRAQAEQAESTARQRDAVTVAMHALSYSEMEAVEQIFQELEEGEGLLVASKIAKQVGITRSVIVNALRKLESAGVIEVRSLGMKGTHIKVMNDYLMDELKKLRQK